MAADPGCCATVSSVREACSWTSALEPRGTTYGLVRAARSASTSRARISSLMAPTPNRSPAPNRDSGRECSHFALAIPCVANRSSDLGAGGRLVCRHSDRAVRGSRGWKRSSATGAVRASQDKSLERYLCSRAEQARRLEIPLGSCSISITGANVRKWVGIPSEGRVVPGARAIRLAAVPVSRIGAVGKRTAWDLAR